MQIAVACMVRNEADIFASFVNHTAQFVDTFYIADHQSNDGTSELLARLEALSGACGVSTHGYNMVSTQYFQRETCRCLADLAFRDGHDWVIFLDADEFLLQGSRPELEAALEECLDGVAAFEWRNLIPSSTVRVGPFQLSQPYTEPVIRRNPPKQKIAISRDFVRRFPFYRLKEGNHGIELAPDYRSFGGSLVGELAHIPIRSEAQARQKAQRLTNGRRPQQRWQSNLQNLATLLSNGCEEGTLIAAAVSLYEGPEDEALENKTFGPSTFFTESPEILRNVSHRHIVSDEQLAVLVDVDILPYGRVGVFEHNGVLVARRLPFAATRHFAQRASTRLHPRRLLGFIARFLNPR